MSATLEHVTGRQHVWIAESLDQFERYGPAAITTWSTVGTRIAIIAGTSTPGTHLNSRRARSPVHGLRLAPPSGHLCNFKGDGIICALISGAAYGALEMLGVGGSVGSAEGLILVTMCI